MRRFSSSPRPSREREQTRCPCEFADLWVIVSQHWGAGGASRRFSVEDRSDQRICQRSLFNLPKSRYKLYRMRSCSARIPRGGTCHFPLCSFQYEAHHGKNQGKIGHHNRQLDPHDHRQYHWTSIRFLLEEPTQDNPNFFLHCFLFALALRAKLLDCTDDDLFGFVH